MINRLSLVFQFLTLMFGLVACSLQDDFGRSRTPVVKERLNDVVGAIQEHTGVLSDKAAYHIPFSRDEEILRATLRHFQKPFLLQPTFRRPYDSQRFSKRKSAVSYQDYMIHYIKSDIRKLYHFKNAVAAVIAHDQQRYKVVAANYDIKENDSQFIRVRIRENRAITKRVLQLIDQRLTDYDQAHEYARLQYPDKEVAVVWSAMDQLRAATGLLKSKYQAYVYGQHKDLPPRSRGELSFK